MEKRRAFIPVASAVVVLGVLGCARSKPPPPVAPPQVGDSVVFAKPKLPFTSLTLEVLRADEQKLWIKATIHLAGTSTRYLLVTRAQAARLPSEIEPIQGPTEVLTRAGKEWKCTVVKSEKDGAVLRAACPERPLGLAGGLLYAEGGWMLTSFEVGRAPQSPPADDQFLDLTSRDASLVDLAMELAPRLRRIPAPVPPPAGVGGE